jgi:protein SCO1/2
MAEGRMGRMRMVLTVAAMGALAVGAGAAVAGGALGGPTFHGTAYEPVQAAPEVHLTGTDGKPLTLAALRGRPVFLFFGYTHCPDVCPLTLARLLAALAAAGDDAKDARVLFVSVDPARDTPPVLAEYARRLGPQVIGATADSASLAAAQAAYGAYVMPAADAGHAMAHSSAVYGIDRKGRLRVLISELRTGSEITDDVRTLVGL